MGVEFPLGEQVQVQAVVVFHQISLSQARVLALGHWHFLRYGQIRQQVIALLLSLIHI